jgi:hypothetical protein
MARCVQTLVDSFKCPPEIIVWIFESPSSPSLVLPPDWFLKKIDRRKVRLGETTEMKLGASIVTIYLNKLDVSSDGRKMVYFTEVYSFSEKFLHEFSVSLDQGRIKRIPLERSIEL